MKQYRTAIIAIIIIAALTATYFIVSPLIEKKDEGEAVSTQTPNNSEPLFNIESVDDIVKYECNYEDDIVLEKNNDALWECVTYTEIPVNQADVTMDFKGMIDIVAEAIYEGDITQEVIDTYGFSEDKYVKITLVDGRTYTINLGMQKPGSGMYFIMIPENNKVYLSNTTYLDMLSITLQNLVNSDVFSFGEAEVISSCCIYKNDEMFVYLDTKMQAEGKAWIMTYPLERDGDSEYIESVISSLTSIETVDYIEGDCKDLEKYGLKKPKNKIYLAAYDNSQSISLGNLAPSGDEYYCTLGDDNNVFTVSTENLNFLDDSVLQYVNKLVYSEPYANLKKADVKIDYEGTALSYVMEIDINGENENYYLDSELLSEKSQQEAFKHLLAAMYGIKLENIENEPDEKGKKLLSIIYTDINGTQTTVECYSRDEITMYLYMNGEYCGGYQTILRITGEYELYGIIKSYENLKNLCNK